MRTFKSTLAGCLALLMLLSLLPFAAAAETDSFRDNKDFLQEWYSTENQLHVFLTNFSDGLSAERLTVTLGGEEIEDLSLEQAKDEPVTYYCLADVSGSMKKDQLSMEREILKTICDNKQPDDRMAIVTLGEETSAPNYLTDPAKINEEIEQLANTNADTNLYKAIADSLEELSSSGKVTRRKCLIVLSDGKDEEDANIGRTKDDAERAIIATRIPVYTVGLTTKTQAARSDWAEIIKTFSGFSRLSVGGEDYSPLRDDLSGEEVGRQIGSHMKQELELTLDLTGKEFNKDELLLTVSYTDANGSTFGDTMTVYTKELIIVEPEPETEPTNEPSEPEPTTDPTGQINRDDEPFPWYWIAGGAALLLGGLAVLLLLLLRKKKQPEPVYEEQETEPLPGPYTDQTVVPEYTPEPEQTGPQCVLNLVAIGYEHIRMSVSLPIGKPVTFGRDSRADIALNPEDMKLSGVHCRVLCGQDGSIRVWDAGSRNGTAVNGVPLYGTQSILLHSGQTLGIGSYEYRVQIQM